MSPLKFASSNFLQRVTLFNKKMPIFTFPVLLGIDFDISVILIVVSLVGVITFLAGIAYGIYLNDKISTKNTSNQFSGS